MAECEYAKNHLKWYDQETIESQTKSFPEFDLVLVDGPMAWDKPRSLSRYPALPFVRPKLAERFSVFLDDTHRSGEQQIADWWQNELLAKKTKVNSNFTMLCKGDFFNPVV